MAPYALLEVGLRDHTLCRLILDVEQGHMWSLVRAHLLCRLAEP